MFGAKKREIHHRTALKIQDETGRILVGKYSNHVWDLPCVSAEGKFFKKDTTMLAVELFESLGGDDLKLCSIVQLARISRIRNQGYENTEYISDVFDVRYKGNIIPENLIKDKIFREMKWVSPAQYGQIKTFSFPFLALRDLMEADVC
jgi:hypothetical protein